MLMDRQTITVDIAPGSGPIQRIRLSQGDIGRPMGVYIIQNGVALDCSAYSAELYILKPDGKFYTTQATVDATETNLIKWETALQETPVAGACAAQIRITAGDDDIGTARFVEFVEASPRDMGSASESEVALLTEYVRQAHESAESAEIDAETASGAASSASGSASTATTAANTATQAATAATAAADRAEAVEESIQEDYSQLSDDVTDLKSAFALFQENIPGTVQTIAFDSAGNVQSITHMEGTTAVRTDVFTFAASTITEVRTLASGESLTIVTNTDTLETTTTYAAA